MITNCDPLYFFVAINSNKILNRIKFKIIILSILELNLSVRFDSDSLCSQTERPIIRKICITKLFNKKKIKKKSPKKRVKMFPIYFNRIKK